LGLFRIWSLGFSISQKCRDRALALSQADGRTDLKVCPYKFGFVWYLVLGIYDLQSCSHNEIKD